MTAAEVQAAIDAMPPLLCGCGSRKVGVFTGMVDGVAVGRLGCAECESLSCVDRANGVWIEADDTRQGSFDVRRDRAWWRDAQARWRSP